MSTTIDQRVVEMRFDNKQFESNVATSMSTLDKLKAKLKLGDSAKSFENIGRAANKVDMRGLGTAVDTVKARFSALDVIAVTALANITNSAVNTAKRMTAALTIEPIKSGFQEYETQLNSVQTILANTQHKGSNIDDVNRALATLNEYADQTIYNFTEMTRNIGAFTAAGVDLQTSVDAIKGIANLAAMSGSSSQQASTAMYQLSQALAAGKVSLMDWNSVVNAGMGGEQFQNALIRTSELLKTGAKDAIATYGSFRESLTQGEWLTTEVLTETLKQLSGAYSEAELISQGFTEKQAKDIVLMANTASDAATKVKTFTQLWDVMKESAQSGWAQTWQIIIGDFEEAKELFTPIAEALTGIIEKTSDLRNNMLSRAFSSPWDQLTNKIEKAGLSTDDFLSKIEKVAKENGIEVGKLTEKYGSLANALKKGKIPADVVSAAFKELLGSEKEVTKETKKLGEIVKKVLNGEFGNGEERVRKLTEAGYDYAEVQNKVNEALGVNVGHAEKLTEEQKKQAESLSKLSDAELKRKGMTDEQIVALRELERAADDSNSSISDLIKNIEKPSGRTLFIEACSNALKFMGEILGEVKKAWDEVFKKDEGDKSLGDRIYEIIEKIHEFTEQLEFSGKKAENFRKVMEGIFSGLSIGNYLLSTSLVAGLKILSAVLDLFDTNLGELAAKIADIIIKFKDWVTENTLFYDTINKTAEIIAALIRGIGDLVNAFMDLEIFADIFERIKQALIDLFDQFGLTFSGFSVDDIVGNIQEAFHNAVNWIKELDTNEVGRNFVIGLVNGIMSGIGMVVEAVVNLGKSVINAIMSVWQEHSPSKVAEDIGENWVLGLINGIREGGQKLWEVIKAVADKVIEVFKNIDWGQLFAAGIIIAAMFLFKKLIDVFDKLVSPLEAVTGMFKKFGGMAESIGNYFDAKKMAIKTNSILKFAIAIGILAASIYLLSKLEWKQIWPGLVAIAGMSAILFALSAAMAKLNSVGDIGLSATGILAIATSLVIIAKALEIMSGIKVTWDLVIVLTGAVLSLVAVMAVMSKIAKVATPAQISSLAGIGFVLIGFASAIYVIAKALDLLSGFNFKASWEGLAVVGIISALFAGIMVLSKYSGKYARRAGSMMLTMSFALLAMLGVIKIAGKLAEDPTTIQNAIDIVGQIMLLFGAVMLFSAAAGKNAAKAGAMMLMMSGALLALVGVIKLIDGLDDGAIERGAELIQNFMGMFMLLMAVSAIAGKNAAKAGAMLLLMSGAMLVLAVAIHLLQDIPPTNLKNAVMAISALMVVFAILIAATHLAKNVKAELVVLTIAVGMLSAFLMALSFLPEDAIFRATGCLSAIIGMFAILVVVTKNVPSDKGFVLKLGLLIGAVGILSALVYMLSTIEPERALASTASLSILMLSFAAALAIMSAVGKTSAEAIGPMMIMMTVVAGLALIIAALSMLPNTESILPIVAGLSLLLMTFAASFAIIGAIGPVANAALPALAVMTAVVVGLAIVLAALSALPNPEALLPIAQALALLLTSMSIVALLLIPIGVFAPAALTGVAALAGVMAGLGAIAVAVGSLMTLIPVEKIETWKEGINKFMDLLSTLTYGLGEVVGNFVAGFLEGSLSSLPTIGQHLSDFMTNIQPFLDGMNSIDESALTGVKTLASILLTLTGANILDALTSWITGGSSLSQFANDLVPFGTAMKQFAIEVADINIEAINTAVNAAQSLVKIAQAIPKDGMFGTDGIDDFGKNIVKFAKCLKSYGTEVAEINIASISASAGAARALVNVAKIIPDDGIFGTDGIDDFGKNIKSFAKSLKNYSDTIATVNVGSINNSATAIRNLVSTINSMASINTSGVSSFKSAVNSLAKTNIAALVKTFSASASKFSVVGSDIVKSISKGINSGQATVVKAANDLVTKMVRTIKSKNSMFKSSGADVLKYFINGINVNKPKATKSMKSLADNMVNALRSKYSGFYSAGKYLVQGFANGISANAYLAKAKAIAMANAAEQAAKAALGERSPSRVFYQIGKYVVMGFSNAIGDYTSMASRATTGMAKSTTNGMRTAIGKIGDALAGDLNINPTIRPVMDLSEVTAGAASINSMFGNPAISATSGFNSISASMRKFQNGFTDEDVVSAINKLRKDLSNIGNTNYNINGITYGDSSDISKAVRTLIRAAKIERRS